MNGSGENTVEVLSCIGCSNAGAIAEEVISHLAGLSGAKVTVTLEIEAEVPTGVPENVIRTVIENGRTRRAHRKARYRLGRFLPSPDEFSTRWTTCRNFMNSSRDSLLSDQPFLAALK